MSKKVKKMKYTSYYINLYQIYLKKLDFFTCFVEYTQYNENNFKKILKKNITCDINNL